MTKHLYYFGWPSDYGGAETKAAHLLVLLAGHIEITVVPNRRDQLSETNWTQLFDKLGIHYCLAEELPAQLDGVALAMCNHAFFVSGICKFATDRGLPVIWSSDMGWHHPYEVDVIKGGEISRLLYVSEVQKKVLDYESFCDVPTRITGNYICPTYFPYHQRAPADSIVVGRLSRDDPQKYPVQFPQSYESLGLKNPRFRVMAWTERMNRTVPDFQFDSRWELLPAQHEPAASFLRSLDLFVYDLGPDCLECWGRSTVEAMLTGAIPIVPNGHHFPNLIVHGETGFLCNSPDEFGSYARELEADPGLRQEMSLACHRHAVDNLCNAQTHRAIWLEALDVK